MAGYIGSKAVSVNTTSATISDDLAVGDDATITGDLAVDGVSNLDVTNIVGNLTVDSDTVTIQSANTTDPVLIIKQKTSDGTSSRLHFVKDGGRNGANGDDLAEIDFIGDDAGQNQTTFGRIEALIASAADGSEGGKIRMRVATHDGEMQTGFEIIDGSTEDEIDVNIGFGAASNTVISGKVLTATGGAGLPSHSFSGDPNTGMFSAAADAIGFGTNGTERMRITTDKVQFNVDAKVDADNSHDLGSSGARWKDLYLSGGVHIGGTGDANKLDDYETGTHDPTISCSSSGSITVNGAINTLFYTKVGQLVSVTGRLSTSSVSSPVGAVNITLPFVVLNIADTSAAVSVALNGIASGSVGDFWAEAPQNQSKVVVYKTGGTNVASTAANEFGSGTDIRITATYMTTA